MSTGNSIMLFGIARNSRQPQAPMERSTRKENASRLGQCLQLALHSRLQQFLSGDATEQRQTLYPVWNRYKPASLPLVAACRELHRQSGSFPDSITLLGRVGRSGLTRSAHAGLLAALYTELYEYIRTQPAPRVGLA
jgi:hypothetical protein